MKGKQPRILVQIPYICREEVVAQYSPMSEDSDREKGLPSLQHKLLRDLLGYDLHIDNTSQGKGILRDRLGGLAVLVVFDDANHFEQINNLLVTDVVGSGSLILITSRDQDLLRRCSPKIVLYNVKALQLKHARELFLQACVPSIRTIQRI